MQSLKSGFVANFAQCMRKLSVACGREWGYSTLCSAELTSLSSFSKPRKPPYICRVSKFCKWNMFHRSTIHRWEVVQIFQREAIFCSKIHSGGSLFFWNISSGGGTNFGGSIFIMTGVMATAKCYHLPGWIAISFVSGLWLVGASPTNRSGLVQKPSRGEA